MAVIVKSVEIERPASEVWAVLEDVRRLPEFSPNTREIRNAPERITEVGQTFCQVVKLLGKRFESDWTVTELDPGRRLGIKGSVGFGAHYHLREDVEPLGDVRCRFSITIDYELPLGGLGRLASRLAVERRADSEAAGVLAGLKELVESAPPT